MRALRIHAAAVDEAVEAAAWYEKERPGLGAEFERAIDAALDLLEEEVVPLTSHADAEARFGASVFWVRQGMLTERGMQEFLETWQTKRDGTRRGVLEVKP